MHICSSHMPAIESPDSRLVVMCHWLWHSFAERRCVWRPYGGVTVVDDNHRSRSLTLKTFGIQLCKRLLPPKHPGSWGRTLNIYQHEHHVCCACVLHLFVRCASHLSFSPFSLSLTVILVHAFSVTLCLLYTHTPSPVSVFGAFCRLIRMQQRVRRVSQGAAVKIEGLRSVAPARREAFAVSLNPTVMSWLSLLAQGSGLLQYIARILKTPIFFQLVDQWSTLHEAWWCHPSLLCFLRQPALWMAHGFMWQHHATMACHVDMSMCTPSTAASALPHAAVLPTPVHKGSCYNRHGCDCCCNTSALTAPALVPRPCGCCSLFTQHNHCSCQAILSPPPLHAAPLLSHDHNLQHRRLLLGHAVQVHQHATMYEGWVVWWQICRVVVCSVPTSP